MGINYINSANNLFEKKLPELLKSHPEEWVAIHQDKILGFYENYAEAYRNAVIKANSEEIMIREITEDSGTPIAISVNATIGLMDVSPTQDNRST